MNKIYLFIVFLTVGFPAEPANNSQPDDLGEIFGNEQLGRVGQYGYPGNPNYDRAIGFLLKGKVKNAVSNHGNFITWDYHPAGFWGDYGYLPHVGFVAGVPGHAYSSKWSKPGDPSWEKENLTIGGSTITIWYSTDAYNAWFDGVDDPLTEEGNYKTVVYNTIDDRGEIAEEKSSLDLFDPEGDPQWVLDHDNTRLYLFLINPSIDPNYDASRVGLAYPWGIRPKLKSRTLESSGMYFDQYNYGADLEEWTSDDEYVYYGATFAESWFIRDGAPSQKTDWQATTDARFNTHNLDNTAGDLFGETVFTDPGDPLALLAHSAFPSTWPTKYSFDTGESEPFWPGGWADKYWGDSPDNWSSQGIYDCNGTRADDGCWKPDPGRFISAMDVYMEFDDRWAHVGNRVVENEYVAAGYPMGLKVMSMAHSYGVAYAEDVMFVTVKVRNESGDFCAFEKDKNENKLPVKDSEGFIICEDGMIMPDGTKLNRGKGFDYKDLYLGFYMDADVLSTDITGGYSVHTNDDDYMMYIDCKHKDSAELYPEGCPVVNNDTLRISMAVIGDYDGDSNGKKGYSMKTGKNRGIDFGVVAVQLLDSPYSTGYVDLDQDGFIDIYPGEKLKMTDWHWFDWWNRPGVQTRSASDTPAKNKELIQYQVIAGDHTNLTEAEDVRYFHTADPETDLEAELNPHFDSLEGLEKTTFFTTDPDGLDCVLEMSTGPFDLKVGEEVSFSFGILFGQNIDDLVDNAYFAQIMYNSHYQGYTYPQTPQVMALTGHNKVELFWTDEAETDKDVITGYTDFEGYKIYRSVDGGATWGSPEDEIVISNISKGWQPLGVGCLDNPDDIEHDSECSSFKNKQNCIYSDFSVSPPVNRDSDSDFINDCYWKYAQFDLSAEADSSFCILGLDASGSCITDENCPAPCIRGVDVQGQDPEAPWYSLGYNTGLNVLLLDADNPDSVFTKVDQNGEEISYKYKFVDNNVIDGVEYTYSVVAYDRGVPPEIVTFNQAVGDSGYTREVVSVPDPGEWGKINPFSILESPKGTTTQDPNFVTLSPGYIPQASLDNITVVPNPYIVNSDDYPEDEWKKKIRFTRLPEICVITIFTISGEKVRELSHNSIAEGSKWWDLRSFNNQEVAPGLYLYVVETPGGAKKIGKFAVVR